MGSLATFDSSSVSLPSSPDQRSRGRMNEQAEPSERRLALQPGYEIVRELDPFDGLAKDELARVENEARRPRQSEAREVRLGRRTSMYRIAVVPEDAEAPDPGAGRSRMAVDRPVVRIHRPSRRERRRRYRVG